MARQAADLEDELEVEFEDEFEFESEWEGEDEDEMEVESEWEDESEDFFPGFGGVANAIGGLLGEGEDELEIEGEDELEDEAFLGLLGPIAKIAGGLLGGGGGDGESEWEDEGEWEDEAEAEEFFKQLKGAFRKAAPFLRTLAKTAGPLVATAIGGPAAGAVARAVTSQLEGEIEGELEAEFEDMATTPLAPSQSFAEYLAAQAAATESESEAEALGGAAAFSAIHPSDRRELERLLPHLLRGAATITRMLHGNRRTRPAVRLVPGITDSAARAVARRIAAGEPIGPVEVGQVMGAAATQALSPGMARQAVLRRHARGLTRARRRYYGSGRGRYYGRRGGQGTYAGRARPTRRGYGAARSTAVRRQPTRSRVTTGRVGRPQPGFVRITTPVRVPPKGGRPARVVRVVSDVRVPRGAVPAGRPSSASSSRRRR